MKSLFNSCCMNWRVIVGLAAVGLGVWLVAPGLVAGAVPLLIVAMCPLSMLVMMGGMPRGQGSSQSACATQSSPASQPRGVARTREEQLAALQEQLSSVHVQYDAIAHEIAQLEAARGVAVREAEAVARAAIERIPEQA